MKDYSNTYNQKVYKVYLSKSLKRDEIKIEKKLLEKRRFLIDNENVKPKDLKIKNLELFKNGVKVQLED